MTSGHWCTTPPHPPQVGVEVGSAPSFRAMKVSTVKIGRHSTSTLQLPPEQLLGTTQRDYKVLPGWYLNNSQFDAYYLHYALPYVQQDQS